MSFDEPNIEDRVMADYERQRLDDKEKISSLETQLAEARKHLKLMLEAHEPLWDTPDNIMDERGLDTPIRCSWCGHRSMNGRTPIEHIEGCQYEAARLAAEGGG